MKTFTVELNPETYVLCEKAAKRLGMTVDQWLVFLLTDKVGHTSFACIG